MLNGNAADVGMRTYRAVTGCPNKGVPQFDAGVGSPPLVHLVHVVLLTSEASVALRTVVTGVNLDNGDRNRNR